MTGALEHSTPVATAVKLFLPHRYCHAQGPLYIRPKTNYVSNDDDLQS